MLRPIKIKIGDTIDLKNPQRQAEEPSDAPVLSAPSASPTTDSTTMPILTIDCSYNDLVSQELEVKKTSPPNGMFGTYDHGDLASFSVASTASSKLSHPPRISRNLPVGDNNCTGRKYAKGQQIRDGPKSGRLGQLGVTLAGRANSKLSQQSLVGNSIKTASQFSKAGQSKRPPLSILSGRTTAASTAFTRVKGEALPSELSEDKPKPPPPDYVIETLSCNYDNHRCLRPAIFGTRFCLEHTEVNPAAGVCQCAFFDGVTACNRVYLHSKENALCVCPEHALKLEFLRGMRRQHHQEKPMICKPLEMAATKLGHARYCMKRASLESHRDATESSRQITFSLDRPQRPEDIISAKVFNNEDNTRFDPLSHAVHATSLELLTTVRDKYDELLECSVRLCSNIHDTIRLRKKMISRCKMAPAGLAIRRPGLNATLLENFADLEAVLSEPSSSVNIMKDYTKARHETVFFHRLKQKKRKREPLVSSSIVRCAYGEEVADAQVQEEKPCLKAALPMSSFCADHIFHDRRNAFFKKCAAPDCNRPSKLWDSHCSFHLTTSLDLRLKRVQVLKMDRQAAKLAAEVAAADPNSDQRVEDGDSLRRSVRLRKRRLEKIFGSSKTSSVAPYERPEKFSYFEADLNVRRPNKRRFVGRPRKNPVPSEKLSASVEAAAQPRQITQVTQFALVDHQYGGASSVQVPTDQFTVAVKTEENANSDGKCKDSYAKADMLSSASNVEQLTTEIKAVKFEAETPF